MRWVPFALVCSLAACGIAHAESPPTPRRLEPVRSERQLQLGIHEGVPWPIVNAPIDGPLPAAPVATEPPPPAATRAAARVLDVLASVESSLRESMYQARTVVRADAGVYHWDCSGMAAWVLRRAAPVALRTLARSRPVARDFAAAIERAPVDRARKGWQRIARLDDVRPGDLFAWRRPRGLPSKSTGHVGFVVARPLPVPAIPGAWAVRIADSTRGYHQDDTRSADPDGGFGIGTLVFLTDEHGNATHYGWSGTRSEWYVVTDVWFGRVHR
jgi:hypothetical protein